VRDKVKDRIYQPGRLYRHQLDGNLLCYLLKPAPLGSWSTNYWILLMFQTTIPVIVERHVPVLGYTLEWPRIAQGGAKVVLSKGTSLIITAVQEVS